MNIRYYDYRAPDGVKCWAVCMNGDSPIELRLTALRESLNPFAKRHFPPHMTVWVGNDPVIEDELMKINIDEIEIVRTFFVRYNGKYLTGYTVNNELLQSYYDLNRDDTVLHITLYTGKHYKEVNRVFENLPSLSGVHKLSKKYIERIDPRFTCV